MQDQTVLILGLGSSGLAMARWCTRQGAAVRVWDSRETAPQDAALRTECPQAQRLQGELRVDQHRDQLGDLDAQASGRALAGVHWVLKSPGLSPLDERVAPLLAQARATGVRVAGELELFVQALAQLKVDAGYAPQLLAITGTNGKTTTTALTALLVERAGRSAVAAGNIGPSLLDTLIERQDAGTLPQVWVLELSSFQLDGVEGFEPSAACILNITQDHLDWHGDMAAYAAAKACIFGGQGVMVINRDDAQVLALEPAAPAEKAKGGKRVAAALRVPPASPRTVLRFGLDAPQHPGDFGLVVENGMAWLVRAWPLDETIKRRKDEVPEIHLQRLMPADALRIRGRHNASNALAALALAMSAGCALAPMLHGLREYRGEPHRVEPIGHVGGIEAFDDSKGTNVGATVAALQGLGAEQAPGKLLLILGGDGKGQDFTPLAAPVAAHVRAIALIGRDAQALGAALQNTGVSQQRFATLEEATAWSFAQAEAGDAVLLSPACASLDMFRNYAHRSEVFVAAVQALAAQRGDVLA